MKNKVKQLIIAGVGILLIVGIMGFTNKDEPTEAELLANMTVEEYMQSDTYQNEHQDVTSYLEVSNVKPTFSTGLYNITGKITNTSNSPIDDIGDLAIFDQSGNLIRVKALEVQLQPNQSMYFDEIVDTKIAGYGVELQGFEN